MDNKKDIQKTRDISHFVHKQMLKIEPFGENKMGERAYRKAERLVAATYLLTNHIDPAEPIRTIVREVGARLLLKILDLRDEMRTVGSTKTSSVEASLRHLISLSRILAVSGFVSFENADLLTEGLDDLAAFIESSRRSVLSENVHLSRENLTDVQETRHESIKDTKDVSAIKDIKGQDAFVHTDTDKKLNVRMRGILETLRNGAELGIKEIAINLPEYSEKMIQRDLADLVSMGQITKVGLKRWSKYLLKLPETPLN